MIVAGKDQIQGWKDIAAYLHRDERTVKRWEKQRGLPVRRIPGGGRANIYILLADLETWLATAGTPTEAPEPEPASTSRLRPEFLKPEQPRELFTESLLSPPPKTHPVTRAHVGWLLGSTLCLLALFAAAIAVHTARSSTPAPSAARGVPRSAHATYSSPHPGVDELYLKGVYLYEERTPSSLERARRCFESVIATDPEDAPAYAGLAASFLLLREYGTMDHDRAYAEAKLAAERAVALDPNLPEAHAALGFIAFFSTWDFAAARREFETALRLDPSSALAHNWYGSTLTHQTRYAEALEQLAIAQRLQPTSVAILANRAYALGLQGHRGEARELLQTVITTNPGSAPPYRALAVLSLAEPREIDRYLQEVRRFAELRNDTQTLASLASAAEALHRSGEPAFWSAMLQAERRRHPSPQHPTFAMAEAEAALGHNRQALDLLGTLAQQHDSLMIGAAMDPLFLPLRGNRSFQRVLAAVGLPTPQPEGNPSPSSEND